MIIFLFLFGYKIIKTIKKLTLIVSFLIKIKLININNYIYLGARSNKNALN